MAYTTFNGILPNKAQCKTIMQTLIITQDYEVIQWYRANKAVTHNNSTVYNNNAIQIIYHTVQIIYHTVQIKQIQNNIVYQQNNTDNTDTQTTQIIQNNTDTQIIQTIQKNTVYDSI